MRFEIYNEGLVGTASWLGPGRVELDIEDDTRRSWFESYFGAEDSNLDGPVECAEMSVPEPRDASHKSFEQALFNLAAYSYTVRAAQDALRGADT